DTLYAEGQRRYVESLSSYARQFLGVMDKPDVDSIEGLSPAISIDQKSTSHNPRSTVGTITEVYDYLRLLFARIGHPHCPNCGREISHLSKEQIGEQIQKELAEKLKSKKQIRFFLLAPLIKDRKGEYSELFQNLRKKGFLRIRLDGQIHTLDEDLLLIKTNKHTIEVVVDRFSVSKTTEIDKQRMAQAIESTLSLSQGEVILSFVEDSSFSFPENPKKMTDLLYSEKYACPVCSIFLPEIEPRTFSFNSPHGACPTCSGIGSLLKVNTEVVFAPNLTIDEGGILPFSKMFENDTWYARIIRMVCQKKGIDLKIPFSHLPTNQKQILLEGTGEEIYRVEGFNRMGEKTAIHETFPGITAELERRHKETDSDIVRNEIEKYMWQETCPRCHGTRLKDVALSVTIDGFRITDITDLSIVAVFNWIKSMVSGEKKDKLSLREKEISTPIFKELISRLGFLVDVGLDYLTLGRNATTLAGGEAQRIRLASQIGSGLSGILYVLDEPSIGLHPRDNGKLIKSLLHLRDIGNSVVVVEHDQETMESADYIFDFGPLAGEHGGNIIASGTPEEIKRNPKSLTGAYLSGKKSIVLKSLKAQELTNESAKFIKIIGAKEHNLKNIDVEFPLGKFICVTGVSGSGKSTLINDILYQSLASKLYPLHREKPGSHDKVEGIEHLEKVVMIDQAPIGRTPRSNPATYTGCFSYIREIFSQTKEARIRGYSPGRFSFNVKGGRCETCEGEGQIKIEMQFLPDVYVACETCNGKRYNEQTLEIFYHDKNISQVLEMTVEEGVNFFSHLPPLANKLGTLEEVGLGYIHLGQPAPQLSGGEAQRIKLASELSKKGHGKTVYLLDEPTTGLHFADLEKLLFVLQSLVALGNTVIVIEHNLDVIKNADWIIDLGPEGGDGGGKIVGVGKPQTLTSIKASYTGKFLRAILK
ncbi:excinuclease ABC subunit UvrA, partial [Candidatus Microgenomates bacterium]|nr:excinuclease ABC subunit UvrA [Candidatus Microgenomates bacterium]